VSDSEGHRYDRDRDDRPASRLNRHLHVASERASSTMPVITASVTRSETAVTGGPAAIARNVSPALGGNRTSMYAKITRRLILTPRRQEAVVAGHSRRGSSRFDRKRRRLRAAVDAGQPHPPRYRYSSQRRTISTAQAQGTLAPWLRLAETSQENGRTPTICTTSPSPTACAAVGIPLGAGLVHLVDSPSPPNAALQPRRFTMALSAVGCKRLLGGPSQRKINP